jgi:hypothetical protein
MELQRSNMATTPPLPTGAVSTPPLPQGTLTFDPGEIDIETGAPNKIRATISAYKKPEDKLKLIRKYYPEALPFGEGNYIFKNPSTGQKTLFNPEGFDFGDVLEYGRVASEIIGSVPGMVAGGLATSPTVAGVPIGVAAGGAAGSVIAGELYDAALRQFFGEDTEDTRTAGEYAGDLAFQSSIEAVTPFPIAKGGQILRTGFDKVFNNATSKAIQTSADNLGIDNLPLGVTGGKNTAKIESGLSATTGGSSITKSYTDGINQLNTAVDDLTSLGSQYSKEAAGDIILNAARKFETDFMQRSDALYNKLGQYINPNDVFKLPGLQKALRKSEFKFNNKELGDVFGKDFADKLKVVFGDGPVQLSYKDIASLRTEIGKQLKGTFVVGTSPSQAGLKELYGALTDDMFKAAESIGGDALKYAKLSNDFYKKGINVLDTQIKPIISKNSGKEILPSEKIYDKVVNGLTTEPSVYNKTLGEIFIPKFGNVDQLKIIGEKQFYDLTRDTAGDLSIGKTVTNINKLKKPTGELPVTIQSLGTKVDDVDQVAKGFKEANKTVNFSNTASANAVRELLTALGLGAGGGFVTGDVSTGASLFAGAYLLPKTISSIMSSKATKQIVRDFAMNSGQPLQASTSVLLGIGFSSDQIQEIIEEDYTQKGLLNE